MPFDVDFVRQRLSPRHIEWYGSIDTTMRRASELASEGCLSGTVVGADQQTAGQGRLGRPWHSTPDEGLYCTFILRVNVPPAQLPVVTLALGLAVADTLRLMGGIEPDLRWPNDVMVEDRKIAGILTQLQDHAILAGIGINVNQASFPSGLTQIATSLLLETGRAHKREPLLVHLAGAIGSYVRMLTTAGIDPILRLFTAASSYASGRQVVVEAPEGAIHGATAGLTPEGFLRLQKEDGSLVTIHAGGVRPAG